MWRRVYLSLRIVAGSWLLKRILDAAAAEKPKLKPELELTK